MKSSTWTFFKDLYSDYLKCYDLDKKDYSVKRFKKAMETAAEVWTLELIGRRNRQNNGLWEYKINNRVQPEPPPVVDSVENVPDVHDIF